MIFYRKGEKKNNYMKNKQRSIQEIVSDTYKKYNFKLKTRDDYKRNCGTLISTDDYCTCYPNQYTISKIDNAMKFDKKMDKELKKKEKK